MSMNFVDVPSVVHDSIVARIKSRQFDAVKQSLCPNRKGVIEGLKAEC